MVHPIKLTVDSKNTATPQQDAYSYATYLEGLIAANTQIVHQSAHTINMLSFENSSLRNEVQTKDTTIEHMKCELHNVSMARDDAFIAIRHKKQTESLLAFILDDTRTTGGLREKISQLMLENDSRGGIVRSLQTDVQALNQQLVDERRRVQTLKDTIFFLQDKLEKGRTVASSALEEFVENMTKDTSSSPEELP